MLLYFFILTILSFFSAINVQFTSSKQVKYSLAFIYIVLLLIAALRYNVGMDYASYKDIYLNAADDPDLVSEPGFILIIRILRFFNLPFEVFIFITASFITTLAFKYIIKYSSLVFVSLLIFFSIGQYYFNTFNAIRQCMAIYCFLYSIYLIKEKNFTKYALIIVFSTIFFHLTAILLLPLYYILDRYISPYVKLATIALILFNLKLALFLIENSSYAIYLKFEDFATGISFNTYLLLFICSFFIFNEFRNKNQFGEYSNIILNINLLALISLASAMFFAGTPLIMVFNRISYYFTPILIVSIPLAISNIEDITNRKIVLWTVTIFFLFISIFSIIANGKSNYIVPYKTIFDSIL